LLWVNLITDSLPAIALGMDPNDPNNMKEKPRDPKESIFSRGGLRDTIMFWAIITVAVLLAYFSSAWVHGANVATYFADADNLNHAQTMAFTTLAFCELFHMIGMSNTKRSFIHVFKNKNFMMLIAFIAGVALQFAVIYLPGVKDIFNTAQLDGKEWLVTFLLALIPLVAHEIIVFIHYLIKKFKK
jgi:Ca2+-transporting ATPase